MRWTAVSLALLGCAGGDIPQEARAECRALRATTPSVEIGTGIDAFAPLSDGMRVDFGPQGGWHTYGSLRTEGLFIGGDGFDALTPVLRFSVEGTQDEFFGGYLENVRLLEDPDGDGRGALTGELLIFNVFDPDRLDGAPVRVDAAVTDACGRTATARGESTLTLGDR